jgi:hypothetical protein
VRKNRVVVIAVLGFAFALIGSAAPSSSTVDRSSSGVSHFLAAASGQCSKADAIDAVKRLGLRDVSATYAVWKVLCGPFTGAGSSAMVASINGPDNVGMLYWAVFRWTGSEWQFLMKQRHAAILTAVGSDIGETWSIFRDGDSHCCPSGGTKRRIWHWDGTRFVAGSWKQVTPGIPVRNAFFYSPTKNISCGMSDDGQRSLVSCQSLRRPQKATLKANGRVTICHGTARCKLGNAGDDVSTLGYGRQITVGRFRCLSRRSGMRCTVILSGKGFLISRGGVSRVGP